MGGLKNIFGILALIKCGQNGLYYYMTNRRTDGKTYQKYSQEPNKNESIVKYQIFYD